MNIARIADLYDVVRERMNNVSEFDVENIAAFIWDEGYARGLQGGDDWSQFLDSLPADMKNYRRPRWLCPASSSFTRRI